ncbi:MAG: hypothetical protein SH856_14210 [Flavobacteriales bacterium]|nr:hypothetical protein [Flavobacteriales bacterium]
MKNILALIAAFVSMQCCAQQMARTLITSCGDHFVQQDFSLSVSVGDAATFIYYEDGCSTVSTGFQQADEFTPCFGDFNHDMQVNTIDLLLLNSDFGSSGQCMDGDLDQNLKVNVADFLIFASVFGEGCGE